MQPMADMREELLWDSEVLIEPQFLQPGHFVARLDRPWRDTPFPLEGILLRDERDIRWMRQHCQWLVVDLVRSENRFTPPGGRFRKRFDSPRQAGGAYLSDEQAAINVLRRARINREIAEASVQAHELLHRQAESLIESISATGKIDSAELRSGIGRMADQLETHLAAMVWLTRIKQADEYTAQHCVNVAILCMGMAHALEWPRPIVERAGLAGMLHDLGKTRVDKQILNKTGPLDDDEYAHVQQHARFGFELLREDRELHPEIARAVLEHHERPDGRGYPMGIGADRLHDLSKLVSVVDAYDAITSYRPYSKPRSHHVALGILWKERNRQFDGDMVEALIQFLGWVTPGTLVRLSDDRHALVVRSSHRHRLWPIVRLLEPGDQGFRVGGQIDLADHNERNPESRIVVAEVLADDALEVELKSALIATGADAGDPSGDD